MPTFRHGKTTAIYLDDKNVGQYFNEVTIAGSADLAETTAFGATGKSYLVGFPDGRVSLRGMFDGTVGAIDEKLAAILAVEPLSVVSIMVEGDVLFRNARSANVRELSYELTSPVSDVVAISAEMTTEQAIVSGKVLHILSPETATANGTSVDHGAATTGGGIGTLHMTANTRDAGSIVVKVQHSVDNSVWVDYITFTSVAAAATTKERIAVSTNPMNRWLRAIWTVTGGTTGSYTFAVNAART